MQRAYGKGIIAELNELITQGGKFPLMNLATYRRKDSRRAWSMLVCSVGQGSRSQNSFLATTEHIPKVKDPQRFLFRTKGFNVISIASHIIL